MSFDASFTYVASRPPMESIWLLPTTWHLFGNCTLACAREMKAHRISLAVLPRDYLRVAVSIASRSIVGFEPKPRNISIPRCALVIFMSVNKVQSRHRKTYESFET